MTYRLGEGEAFHSQKPSNRNDLIQGKNTLYLITINIKFTNFGTWEFNQCT